MEEEHSNLGAGMQDLVGKNVPSWGREWKFQKLICNIFIIFIIFTISR